MQAGIKVEMAAKVDIWIKGMDAAELKEMRDGLRTLHRQLPNGLQGGALTLYGVLDDSVDRMREGFTFERDSKEE